MNHSPRAVLVLAVVGLLGCERSSREIVADPQHAPLADAGPPTPPVASVPWADALVGHVGDVVAVEGRVSSEGKPHVAKALPGKSAVLLRLLSGNEIVTHATTTPICPDRMVMTGKVFVVAGTLGKGVAYAEPQLDVVSSHCAIP